MRGQPWCSPGNRRRTLKLECLLMLGAMVVAILQYTWVSQHVSMLDGGGGKKRHGGLLKESSMASPSRLVSRAAPSASFIESTRKTRLGSNSTNSKYAYAFIVGSVHESKKAYRGFLFNVLCAVQVLREFDSQADFVAYLQPSPNSTLTSLPEEDVRWLKAMNIRIIALDKPAVESFADLMFDKFRIFQLTEYKRVIYLDSDILPVNSLDYLFHLSDPEDSSTPTPLRPNIMQASGGEPANGGMFMVQPFEGAWEQVQAVIARQRQEGKSLPYPNFSRGIGWGHRFRKRYHDNWHAAKNNGTNWVFHGAHADQGLLYYFMRFVLQDVSHIVGRRLENWGSNPNHPDAAPSIVKAYDNVLWEYSERHPPFLQVKYCYGSKQIPFYCYPPYRDYSHFTGRRKPWQNPIKAHWLQKNLTLAKHRPKINGADQFWFWTLHQLNEQLHMEIDLERWNRKVLPIMRESPLGYLPLYSDNTNRIFENTTSDI